MSINAHYHICLMLIFVVVSMSFAACDKKTPATTGTAVAAPVSMEKEIPKPIDPKRKIAFCSDRDGNMDLFIMKEDGGDAVNLTKHPAIDRCPAWSPDGKRIAFSTDRDGNFEIYTYDIEGGKFQRLTYDDAQDSMPDWSPDAQKIVFVSEKNRQYSLIIVDVTTRTKRSILENDQTKSCPNWHPDGNRIFFLEPGTIEVIAIGGKIDRIVSKKHMYAGLAVSPAGDKIVYGRLLARGGVSADTSKPPQKPTITSSIEVMESKGWPVEQILKNQSDNSSPTWSPDGKKIAFSSDIDGNDEIYVMNADGTNIKRLTNHKAKDYYPAWSPIQ